MNMDKPKKSKAVITFTSVIVLLLVFIIGKAGYNFMNNRSYCKKVGITITEYNTIQRIFKANEERLKNVEVTQTGSVTFDDGITHNYTYSYVKENDEIVQQNMDSDLSYEDLGVYLKKGDKLVSKIITDENTTQIYFQGNVITLLGDGSLKDGDYHFEHYVYYNIDETISLDEIDLVWTPNGGNTEHYHFSTFAE